jgi:sugar (pentulose or hexulose) kinase
MYTIGIDIGSTFIKAAVFDIEKKCCISNSSIPFPSRVKQDYPECFQVPAEEILSIVKTLIDQAVKIKPLDYILFSTQMHGFIYEAENSCQAPVYVSWQDSYCTLPVLDGDATALKALSELLSHGELNPSGISLKPSLGLCNLYARINSKLSPVPTSGELFTLGSWIIHKLTGRNICHITNAAPLGLTDITRNSWNKGLIATLGFQQIKLPEIAAEDFEVCGYYNGIAVLPDYGDQQVSILGSQPSPGDVLVNIATAGQVSINTECFNPGYYEVRPFFQSTYINTISNLPSGRNLAVLASFLRMAVEIFADKAVDDAYIYNKLHELWKNGPVYSNGLSADTLFFPTDKKTSGGSISNIREDNFTPGALLSAFYENISEIYKDNILTLLAGTRPQRLLFLGGVSWKNPDLVEAIANRFGISYKKSPMPDEALNGMYRLSLMACHKISHLTESPELQLNKGNK